jgi:predicted GNAT family acetyltransferase
VVTLLKEDPIFDLRPNFYQLGDAAVEYFGEYEHGSVDVEDIYPEVTNTLRGRGLDEDLVHRVLLAFLRHALVDFIASAAYHAAKEEDADEDPPEPEEYDPGPEVDDEGGMSEVEFFPADQPDY